MGYSTAIWELVSAVFCREAQIDFPIGCIPDCDNSVGAEFEYNVFARLQSMARQYNGVVFRNLYVPYRNSAEVAQVDCVVLLPDRLLVVECKDCSGRVDCESVLADNEKPYWKQAVGDGSVYWLYSPVAQNMTHVRAVSALTGVSYPKCFSLVIFSQRSQLLNVPDVTGSQAVIQLDDLKHLNFQPVPSRMFSSYKFNFIIKKLEQCQPTTALEEKHQEYVQLRSTGRVRSVAPSVCPQCGSSLQERHGSSHFLGCSMYPLCDYTFNLEG